VFDGLESFARSAHDFILAQPVLVVIFSGLIASIWSAIGESITYWAARLGGRPLINKMARWFRMDARHMERTETMFLRWGVKLVLFGRIFPGVRTLVSVPAGLTRMNFGLFLSASLSGAYIWNTLLAGAGYILGFKWMLLGLSILR